METAAPLPTASTVRQQGHLPIGASRVEGEIILLLRFSVERTPSDCAFVGRGGDFPGCFSIPTHRQEMGRRGQLFQTRFREQNRNIKRPRVKRLLAYHGKETPPTLAAADRRGRVRAAGALRSDTRTELFDFEFISFLAWSADPARPRLRMEATDAWLDLYHRLDRCDHGDSLVVWLALSALLPASRERARAMTVIDTPPRAVGEATVSYFQWGAIVAGAIAAAALAGVLHTFAGAIGVAVSSTAPTWRDGSVALWLLSGLYLILVAFVAYGLGGYIAGRARAPLVGAHLDEVEMRDGGHGLVAWALATLLTGLLTIAAAQSLTRLAAPSSGASGPATSVAGENIIAFDIDRLFRTERPAANVDMTYPRAEAARILLTAGGHSGVSSDDRTYLIRLVAARTGLAQPDAERRADAAIASARENITRARRAAVILAFMAGAAALLGAAVSWFAACAGGRHRDGLDTFAMTGWGILGRRL